MQEKLVKELFEKHSADFFGTQMQVDGEPIRLDGGAQHSAYKVKSGENDYVVKVFSESKYPDDPSINVLITTEVFAESLKEKGCATVSALTSKKDGSRVIRHAGLRCMYYPYINGEKVNDIEDIEQLQALTKELSKVLKHSTKVNDSEVEKYDFSKFDELKRKFVESKMIDLKENDFIGAKKFIKKFNELDDSKRRVETVFTHYEINQYNCIFSTDDQGKVQANIIDWENCANVPVFRVFLAFALENCNLWDGDKDDIDFEKFKVICEIFFKENTLKMEEFEYAFTSCGIAFVDWLQKNLKIATHSKDEFERQRSAQTCVEVVPVFEKMEKIKMQVKLIIDRCIEAQKSSSSSLTV